MNCQFLHFSAFTVFLPIKSTRLVCNLLHFSLKNTMNCHFLHFSAFTVFLPMMSTRLVCNLLHFSLKNTTLQKLKWSYHTEGVRIASLFPPKVGKMRQFSHLRCDMTTLVFTVYELSLSSFQCFHCILTNQVHQISMQLTAL